MTSKKLMEYYENPKGVEKPKYKTIGHPAIRLKVLEEKMQAEYKDGTHGMPELFDEEKAKELIGRPDEATGKAVSAVRVFEMKEGVKIEVGGTRYRITSVRPNGKVVMVPIEKRKNEAPDTDIPAKQVKNLERIDELEARNQEVVNSAVKIEGENAVLREQNFAMNKKLVALVAAARKMHIKPPPPDASSRPHTTD